MLGVVARWIWVDVEPVQLVGFGWVWMDLDMDGWIWAVVCFIVKSYKECDKRRIMI